MLRRTWRTVALVLVIVVSASGGCSRSAEQERREATAQPNGSSPAAMDNGMNSMPGMAMDGPGITVDPARQQLIGMRLAEATVRPLEKTIRTVGRVEYDERKVKQVTTKTEGWIEHLHVDFTGKLVKRGDPLFTIYSPELVSTQEEYLLALEAKRRVGSSPFPDVAAAGGSLVEAARRRLLLWDISAEQIASLERTGQPTKTLTLRSPIDGFVIEKMAAEGMRVDRSMALYKIADLSTVWVHADLYEYELPVVREGQEATVRLSYYPGQRFQGQIIYVYPFLDGKTRTGRVRFEFPNTRDWTLKPGMFADVELKVPLGRRLAVPREAILDSGTRQVVFIEKAKGHFEPREVTLGLRVEDHQEIVAGLDPGTRVVASANFFLDSESKLRESMGLMAGMPGMERMRMGGMEGMEGMRDMPMSAPVAAGPQERTVQGITLTFTTVPSPPKVGDNLLRVRLTDSKGQVVKNAKVTFDFTMPMPGMTLVTTDGMLSKDGFYEARANLGMGGTWHVTVTAAIPGKPEVKETFEVGAGAR
jgi:Cu(I)/Ag(I) efflux system membrane fusion protein